MQDKIGGYIGLFVMLLTIVAIILALKDAKKNPPKKRSALLEDDYGGRIDIIGDYEQTEAGDIKGDVLTLEYFENNRLTRRVEINGTCTIYVDKDKWKIDIKGDDLNINNIEMRYVDLF